MFDEVVLLDEFFKGRVVGEVVVYAVFFAGAWGTGGVGDGEAEEVGVVCEKAVYQGGFAGAAGAAEDDGSGRFS